MSSTTINSMNRFYLFLLCFVAASCFLGDAAQVLVQAQDAPPRNRRSSRGGARAPRDLFGEERANSPSADATVLGGTVPAIWEIEQSLPAWDDENLPNLLERDTLAPPVSGKVIRYTALILQRCDTDGDGKLQSGEWKKMPGSPQAIDINGDDAVTMEELVWFFASYGQGRTIHRPESVKKYEQSTVPSTTFQFFKPVMPQAPSTTPDETAQQTETEDGTSDNTLPDEDTPLDDAVYEEIISGKQVSQGKKYYTPSDALRGVPSWFLVRDTDGDGQVSLLEFAPSLSPRALALFGKLDKNGDGFITPDEVRTGEEK